VVQTNESQLPSVEENDVRVVAHDPEWAEHYVEEARLVKFALGERCAEIEHVGSTSVPGLFAKPIIDILVASSDGLAPSSRELRALADEGYTFLGEDGRRPGRWFWRKRGVVAFNLSLVPTASELWCDNIRFRNYLRMHPHEADSYSQIKLEGAASSPNSLLGYQNYKRTFIELLKQRALAWELSSAS
jgi:GrpB-like predicted nucleotidyltransferase (UPF0157 family)